MMTYSDSHTEFRSIERAKELSDNEDKMIIKLNEKLK